ncbi:phenylalanine racemase, partial [Candidatus Bipolaricaulota bacterium]
MGDPFVGESWARVYRSGDTVYLHPDGNLHFLARTDRQVKIRGFRVEPGESESVLLELPEVYDVAVL